MSGLVKILIVDDDPSNVDLMSDICAASGYAVISASNGELALQMARVERPDLMLLDVMMPGMDGYEVLAKLKVDVRLSEMPVILVTAADEAEAKMRGLGSGAVEFVQKPFRAMELIQRIKNVLELHAAKRQLRDAEVELVSLRATDPVTGVGNFQRLHAVLEYEFGRASRYNRPLSCAVIADESIDALLSASGRDFADTMLRNIAQTIRDEVREVDRVFRIDMSEFVMIFPETPAAGAHVAVERICKSIMEYEGQTGHHPKLYTAFASFPHDDFKRAEDLFRAINIALDQARRIESRGPVFVEFTTFV